jgi:alpha-1,2-mannosyltransferase
VECISLYVSFCLVDLYLIFNAMIFSAFLPSSFVMYTTTVAFSYALEPVSSSNRRRTFLATLLFAVGGIVGWPFSLALAIPFVAEELFVFGVDRVLPETRWSWSVGRWKRLFAAGAAAALLFVCLTFLLLLYSKSLLSSDSRHWN